MIIPLSSPIRLKKSRLKTGVKTLLFYSLFGSNTPGLGDQIGFRCTIMSLYVAVQKNPLLLNNNVASLPATHVVR